MKIQKFEDLIARQKSQDIAIDIYASFKEIKDWGFKDQICRAAVSISNNIAEGFDRQSKKEFIRFLYIALGSCSEVKSMLYLAKRLNYLDHTRAEKLQLQSIEISKIITGLIRSLDVAKTDNSQLNTDNCKTITMKNLEIGDKAPAITAKNQNGETIQLSDFTGKKVILYFYPKDNTPGCTTEACNFRDNYQSLLSDGFEVLGVSIDSEQSHQKFITKHDLPFNLLADEDQKIVNDYGVWVEKNMYGRKYMGTARTTFVIDEEGIIRHIIKKVDNKNASQQIRDLVG